MPKTFLLVDSQNVIYKAIKTPIRHTSDEDRPGLNLHIFLNSVQKAVNMFDPSHVVFCFDHRSWRKELYEGYKGNRPAQSAKMKSGEREIFDKTITLFDECKEFIETKTNSTVLQTPRVEADDFIARWIHLHPDDNHVILSGDTDFYQLVNDRVSIYKSIEGHTVRLDGIYNDKGKPVLDSKTKAPKTLGDPDYVLFLKCIRGDATDHIFSAYPGAREANTNKKIGIKAAWEDHSNRGFNWNNFMLQRWTDPEGNEHLVKTEYERNKLLIDLTCQPEDVKLLIDNQIKEKIDNPKTVQHVGFNYMKFLNKHNLEMLSNNTSLANYLNAKY